MGCHSPYHFDCELLIGRGRQHNVCSSSLRITRNSIGLLQEVKKCSRTSNRRPHRIRIGLSSQARLERNSEVSGSAYTEHSSAPIGTVRDREVGSSNLPAPTHEGLSYRGRPKAKMPRARHLARGILIGDREPRLKAWGAAVRGWTGSTSRAWPERPARPAPCPAEPRRRRAGP